MNTNKSVVRKWREAFPKTSIKFEKRFKKIFCFPEIGSHAPFPSPRDLFTLTPNREPVHRLTKGARDWEQGGRKGRVILFYGIRRGLKLVNCLNLM